MTVFGGWLWITDYISFVCQWTRKCWGLLFVSHMLLISVATAVGFCDILSQIAKQEVTCSVQFGSERDRNVILSMMEAVWSFEVDDIDVLDEQHQIACPMMYVLSVVSVD